MWCWYDCCLCFCCCIYVVWISVLDSSSNSTCAQLVGLIPGFTFPTCLDVFLPVGVYSFNFNYLDMNEIAPIKNLIAELSTGHLYVHFYKTNASYINTNFSLLPLIIQYHLIPYVKNLGLSRCFTRPELMARNESFPPTSWGGPTNHQGSTWARSTPQGPAPRAPSVEVFHIVLQEAPCTLLQLLNLRKYWRPRLVAMLTLPLLCLRSDCWP